MDVSAIVVVVVLTALSIAAIVALEMYAPKTSPGEGADSGATGDVKKHGGQPAQNTGAGEGV